MTNRSQMLHNKNYSVSNHLNFRLDYSVPTPDWFHRDWKSFCSNDSKHLLKRYLFLLGNKSKTTINLSSTFRQKIHTVFTRINAAAFNSFLTIQLRRLFEGGVYSGGGVYFKTLYSFNKVKYRNSNRSIS